MNWIVEHYIEIFALIGAAYSLARIIVNLTPTPSDNAALDKVGVFLKAVGKVFGMDLTVGVDTKNEKGKSTIIAMLLITMIGCATYSDIHKDPRAEYKAALQTYTAVVNSLASLIEEEAVNDAQIKDIDRLVYDGKDLLDSWHEKVIGELPPDPAEKNSFKEIMNKLFSYEGGK